MDEVKQLVNDIKNGNLKPIYFLPSASKPDPLLLFANEFLRRKKIACAPNFNKQKKSKCNFQLSVNKRKIPQEKSKTNFIFKGRLRKCVTKQGPFVGSMAMLASIMCHNEMFWSAKSSHCYSD